MLQINALEVLIRDHKARDIEHDQKWSPYTPTVGVIANRIAGYYEQALREEILDYCQEVGESDVWIEYAPEERGRVFQIGFRDNRTLAEYVARLAALSRALGREGWDVRLSEVLFVVLPPEIETQATEVYPAYLKEIGKGPAEVQIKEAHTEKSLRDMVRYFGGPW